MREPVSVPPSPRATRAPGLLDSARNRFIAIVVVILLAFLFTLGGDS